jgi:hypothetical protein
VPALIAEGAFDAVLGCHEPGLSSETSSTALEIGMQMEPLMRRIGRVNARDVK